MEATWQDYATWAIGAAALVAVAVRIARTACGRRRGGWLRLVRCGGMPAARQRPCTRTARKAARPVAGSAVLRSGRAFGACRAGPSSLAAGRPERVPEEDVLKHAKTAFQRGGGAPARDRSMHGSYSPDIPAAACHLCIDERNDARASARGVRFSGHPEAIRESDAHFSGGRTTQVALPFRIRGLRLHSLRQERSFPLPLSGMVSDRPRMPHPLSPLGGVSGADRGCRRREAPPNGLRTPPSFDLFGKRFGGRRRACGAVLAPFSAFEKDSAMTKHTSRKATAAAKRNGTLRSALSFAGHGCRTFRRRRIPVLRREHRDAAFTVGRWATPVLLLGVYDLLRKQGCGRALTPRCSRRLPGGRSPKECCPLSLLALPVPERAFRRRRTPEDVPEPHEKTTAPFGSCRSCLRMRGSVYLFCE